MSSITDTFVKKEKLPFSVKEEGRVGNLYYLVAEGKENFFVYNDRRDIFEKYRNLQEFMEDFPKFGKYEVEAFLSERVMTALFITRNLTDVMNMTVMCEGVKFDRKDISDRLFKHFFRKERIVGNSIWLAINVRK